MVTNMHPVVHQSLPVASIAYVGGVVLGVDLITMVGTKAVVTAIVSAIVYPSVAALRIKIIDSAYLNIYTLWIL